MTTQQLEQMSDELLVAETKRVAEIERRSTAELLALLMEVERRGLHLALGHSSLFAYCRRVLHLSEQAAYSRITAARAARRYPAVIGALTDGSLTLSSVGLLAPHLADDNVEALLGAARHKSTWDVERLIAALHPQPDIPASLRALPVPQLAPAPTEGPTRPAGVATLSCAPPARTHTVLAPLAPKRYLLKLTIGQETHDKLERARALLRHAIPDGDPAVIIDRALTLLLHQAERTKFAATSRPKQTISASPAGRHVSAAVRRRVRTRDAGRCAFEGADGRCGETAFLEFHHVIPFAAGGPTDDANLQLRCRAHNAHEATVYFGAGVQSGRLTIT